jgi:hypothetical protein
MTTTVLLIGRTQSVIDDVMSRVHAPDTRLLSAGGIEDVRAIFAERRVDHVIIGGGLDLVQRIEVVRTIFETSSSTKVYMNSPSGPDSFLPFVQSILFGIQQQRRSD